MTRVTGGHHVLGVEDLLRQFRHGQGPVLLGASRRQGSEPGHEEVETGEGHHVDCDFPEVGVQLTWVSESILTFSVASRPQSVYGLSGTGSPGHQSRLSTQLLNSVTYLLTYLITIRPPPPQFVCVCVCVCVCDLIDEFSQFSAYLI